ncbi:hypothetical protein KFE25_000347 [Diacronema lutheri]|uniref:EngB-type G domain-containing protein n=1 Tax=Diacronema lutheri TaxID=2081491 RepID=A0A8J6CDF0_DIALT|nr:hypothetical protein KFE25_000347 [Diacronema lutheri]
MAARWARGALVPHAAWPTLVGGRIGAPRAAWPAARRLYARRAPPPRALSVDEAPRARRRGERADGGGIAARRAAHLALLSDEATPFERDVLRRLTRSGFATGRSQKAAVWRRRGDATAEYIGCALLGDWPDGGGLPEVALVGQSNSGKSSLLNAFLGSISGEGLAPVSARAGWTAHLSFFRLSAELAGEFAPRFVLVDMPGYGDAVADTSTRRTWRRAIRAYLSHRPALLSVLLLVDAERGLETEDRELLARLVRAGTPHALVLTRCDLLSPLQLARCHYRVSDELGELNSAAAADVPMISVLTGVGVRELWERLLVGVAEWQDAQLQQPEDGA